MGKHIQGKKVFVKVCNSPSPLETQRIKRIVYQKLREISLEDGNNIVAAVYGLKIYKSKILVWVKKTDSKIIVKITHQP